MDVLNDNFESQSFTFVKFRNRSCLKQVKSNISFIFSPPTFLTAVQTFEDSSCKKYNKLLGGGNTLLH